MAQEFTINSPDIESKLNSLLPSQGGFGTGIDYSASTMIIPVVNVTESAEGSNLRLDLQTALDTASTAFSLTSATNTTLISTTGFYRVFGTNTQSESGGGVRTSNFNLFDGVTANNIYTLSNIAGSQDNSYTVHFDFIVFIKAGVSLRGTASGNSFLSGSTRQIADITGNLTNPQGF